MFTIISIMFIGIGIGYLMRNVQMLQKVEKSASLTILLLLFVLGVSIGSNRLIVDNLGRFGWQAYGRFLELRNQNGGKRIISKSATHRHAVEHTPLAQQQTGEGREQQRSHNGGHRHQKHFGPQALDQLLQFLVAPDADAHLEHQCIEHIHG